MLVDVNYAITLFFIKDIRVRWIQRLWEFKSFRQRWHWFCDQRDSGTQRWFISVWSSIGVARRGRWIKKTFQSDNFYRVKWNVFLDSPIKRQTKFCFESKVDSSGSSTDKPCPSGITGKEEDNTICSVCLKKIVATKGIQLLVWMKTNSNPKRNKERSILIKIPASYNIFTNVTPNNKSLSDVLKSIVNVDVDQTLSDGNLCKACFDAISKVETLFYDFRRAADSIKVTFELLCIPL